MVRWHNMILAIDYNDNINDTHVHAGLIPGTIIPSRRVTLYAGPAPLRARPDNVGGDPRSRFTGPQGGPSLPPGGRGRV
jgi:hypothetical protein